MRCVGGKTRTSDVCVRCVACVCALRPLRACSSSDSSTCRSASRTAREEDEGAEAPAAADDAAGGGGGGGGGGAAPHCDACARGRRQRAARPGQTRAHQRLCACVRACACCSAQRRCFLSLTRHNTHSASADCGGSLCVRRVRIAACARRTHTHLPGRHARRSHRGVQTAGAVAAAAAAVAAAGQTRTCVRDLHSSAQLSAFSAQAQAQMCASSQPAQRQRHRAGRSRAHANCVCPPQFNP
jgi:hypothetical protein